MDVLDHGRNDSGLNMSIMILSKDKTTYLLCLHTTGAVGLWALGFGPPSGASTLGSRDGTSSQPSTLHDA